MRGLDSAAGDVDSLYRPRCDFVGCDGPGCNLISRYRMGDDDGAVKVLLVFIILKFGRRKPGGLDVHFVDDAVRAFDDEPFGRKRSCRDGVSVHGGDFRRGDSRVLNLCRVDCARFDVDGVDGGCGDFAVYDRVLGDGSRCNSRFADVRRIYRRKADFRVRYFAVLDFRRRDCRRADFGIGDSRIGDSRRADSRVGDGGAIGGNQASGEHARA